MPNSTAQLSAFHCPICGFEGAVETEITSFEICALQVHSRKCPSCENSIQIDVYAPDPSWFTESSQISAERVAPILIPRKKAA